MTTIKWIPIDFSKDFTDHVANITHFEPEPAFKYLNSAREDSNFLKCPGLSGFLKNMFVIRCPLDITLEIDVEKQTCRTNDCDQKFFDNNMMVNYKKGKNDPMILHFFPKYMYVTDSKEPVEFTMLPWFFRPNEMALIPGSFDITKWIRTTEPAFEIYQSGTYTFKRGEPLYCVHFKPESGKLVKLEKGVMTEELRNANWSCVGLKTRLPGLNLKTIYSISHDYIEIMKKRIFKSFG